MTFPLYSDEKVDLEIHCTLSYTVSYSEFMPCRLLLVVSSWRRRRRQKKSLYKSVSLDAAKFLFCVVSYEVVNQQKISSRRAFEDVIIFCRVCHAHEFLTVAMVNSNKYGNGANWIDWCAIEEIVGILSRIVRLTPKRSIEITVNHFILIMRRTYWRNFCTMNDIIMKYYSPHAFWFYNY